MCNLFIDNILSANGTVKEIVSITNTKTMAINTWKNVNLSREWQRIFSADCYSIYCPGNLAGAYVNWVLDAIFGGIPGVIIGSGLFAVVYPGLKKNL